MSVKSGGLQRSNEKITELKRKVERISQQNEVLETQLTDAQIALCEIYESVVLSNG